MNNLTTANSNQGLTVDEILGQKRVIAELMSKVLKKNEHYGIIPGTSKPTLYKAGAEIIAQAFGIHPEFEIKKTNLEGGHIEYEILCKMYRNSDGMKLAEGVGSCSSMESKYRWRTIKKFNPETKKQEETRIENPNREDQYNTVLKMAKKRAFLDAVITTTGASDFVTQDLEDLPEKENPYKTEVEMIDTIEKLTKHYEQNKGRGAEFDKAILERKKELLLNKKK